MLADGDYDAFVLDALREPDEENVTRVELTVTSGPNKGDVVAVRATRVTRDPIELIGLPATIRVRDGAPEVTFEG